MRRLFRVGGSFSWEIGSRMFHGRLSADRFYRSGWAHAGGYPLGQSPWSQTIQGTEFWPLGKVCPRIVLRCLLNFLFCQLKAFLSRAPQREGTTVPFICFEGNWLTFCPSIPPLECPDPFTFAETGALPAPTLTPCQATEVLALVFLLLHHCSLWS